jgi:hypothetical protein
VTQRDRSLTTHQSTRQAVIFNLLIGLATAIVVFAGVPTVLIWAVGVKPFTPSNPSFFSAAGLLDLLALVVWVSWVACCYPLVASVIRRVKSRDLSSATRPLSVDRLGIRIASAILVLGSALVTIGDAASGAVNEATPLPRTGPPPLATSNFGPMSRMSADGDAHSPIKLPPSRSRVHDRTPVRAADETLSSNADEPDGDGDGWKLVARRNIDRASKSGQRFVDPNRTSPGWMPFLPLPSNEGADGATHADTSSKVSTAIPVQEFCAMGLGALGAAALARRLRRRRSGGNWNSTPETADEATVDAAVLVEQVQDTTLLTWIELANTRLGSELTKVGDSRDIPGCRLVRATQSDIEFLLTMSVSWAPRGFELKNAGFAWRFPIAESLREPQPDGSAGVPWIRVLLPIGTNADGTWLVNIARGGCVSVLGPAASSLVSTMKIMADGWAWSENLIVSTDPTDTASIVDLNKADDQPKAVLFVGDPNAIDLKTRSHCSVLTTSTDTSAETIVVVDDRSATLHPFGITLRPNGMDHRLAESLTRLADGVTSLPETLVSPSPSDPQPFAHSSATPNDRRSVEVRLLTAIPRIDGLHEALSPKRARRAIEVVAYLGLHRPDPVTSDRLRTRVLGTRESDAAAKTLFNTVGAARRALGLDAAGAQLLPPASKSGHYRLSDEVGVDVVQSISLCAAADDAEDDEAAMALYRAALALVEGEPFSGTLSGYSWWRAEGYEARVTVVLVEAACRLSELAVRARLLELARWALERGRMIDPYSELLSRSGLTLAASSGDFARLRREWLECQRRVDELDPGCLPSEATTRLFTELSDRLSVAPS